MANIGDVFLRVLAETSGFAKQVKTEAQQAGDVAGGAFTVTFGKGLSRAARDVGQTLQGIGRDVSRTGQTMARDLTLPLVAAGAVTTSLALDFDTTLRRIVGLTDVTADQLDLIRQRILALSGDVGKTPQELAEAFYFVASAGFAADEAMVILETSARAAAAGLGETQTIAQVLGSVINAYGKKNITAARAADILTEAVSQGTAESTEFAGVIGRVVPAAAAMGVTFEDVAAALAGMTLTGLSAEEAAVGLNQVFISLLKPTAQANEALESLGLSSEELRRQLKEEGLLATLRTLEERFAGNETASAAVFGNVRALRTVTALLTLDSEQLNAVFAKVTDSAGRLGEAYEETEGPQREIDRSMAQLQATAIELGQDVLPVVVEIFQILAEAAKELAAVWRDLDPETRRLVVQILAVTAAAGPLLLVVGKIVGVFASLAKGVAWLAGPQGLVLMGTRLRGLFAIAGKATPWLLLVSTIIELPDAINQLSRAFSGLAKGNRSGLQQGIDALQEFNQGLGAMGPLAGVNLVLLGQMETDLHNLAGAAEEGATAMTEAWAQAWLDSGLDARRGTEEITDAVATVLEDGTVLVEDAADAAIEDPIAGAIAEARQKVADETLALINNLQTVLATGPDEIEDEMQAIVDALVDPFTSAERIAQIRGQLVNGALIDALTSDDPRLEADTFAKINDWLHQWELADPAIFEIGSGFFPSLTAGMQTNLQAAVDWVAQNMGIDFVDQFDLADQLQAMGYDGLAAYVRGQEQARLDRLKAEQDRRKSQEALAFNDQISANRTFGYDAGIAYAEGYQAASTAATGIIAKNFIKPISQLMQYAQSPPYTEIRKIGANVGRFWAEEIIRAGQRLIPSIASMAGTAAAALAVQTGATGLGSYPVPTLMAPVAAAAGSVPAVESVVTNQWILSVNGVPYSFNTKDDFIRALDDLSSFSGDGRLGSGG